MEPFQEPCPACGGVVHQVAGRCKHCKADLVALRAAAQAARQAADSAARVAGATSPGPPPGARDRRWWLIAAAAVVLVLGAGAGALVATIMRGRAEAAPREPRPLLGDARGTTSSPGGSAPGGRSQSPDWLPPGLRPGTGQGTAPTDPAPLDPADPNDPDPDPTFPLPPGMASPFGLPMPFGFGMRGPLPRTARPSPRTFASQVADRLCDRMAACGVFDDLSAGVCRVAVAQLEDLDAEAMVQQGRCRFDATRARACLDKIGGLRCDQGVGDPTTLLALGDLVSSCTRALDCD